MFHPFGPLNLAIKALMIFSGIVGTTLAHLPPPEELPAYVRMATEEDAVTAPLDEVQTP